MEEIHLTTPNGERIILSASTLERFASRIRGELISPGNGSYDEARKLWNGMIDKKPGLIVRCSGASDVIHSINFARDKNILFTVRSGGHNVAGLASIDDGMVIDLSKMRGVQVDPERRRVQVQGGAILGDVDRETQPFGLAVPIGLVSETGIAGLTLGGGMGWLTRSHGFTIDNLIAADVVTADGSFRRAQGDQNEDLLWALKGGGGSFGVVTQFTYQAHEVGPDIWFAGPMYPLEKAEKILTELLEFMATAPEELGVLATYWSIPRSPDIPEELHGRPVVILLACYTGPFEAGERAILPLRELDRPLFDLSAPMKFDQLQKFLDPDYPDGRLYYWKSLYFSKLDSRILTQLTEHAAKRPSEISSIDIWFLGGASSRVHEDETPFSHRKAGYMIALESNWDRPEDSERNVSWTRDVFDQLKQYSTGGSYLNFPGFADEDEAYLKNSYGKNFERLVGIKKKYDPENLFRGNFRIAQ